MFRLLVVGATALGLAGAAALTVGYGARSEAPPAPEVRSAVIAPVAAVASGPPALGRSTPTHLRISRIGVDTDLVSLGLNPDGTVEVPPDTSEAPAGWYRNLASPGEAGPAVVLGHLDAPGGRGVFFNLGATRLGDEIAVTRADGSVATFTVDAVSLHPRTAFPTEQVYGPTARPTLRLVTCGGEFSPTTGYSDNVIVSASLTSSSPPIEAPDARPEEPVAAPTEVEADEGSSIVPAEAAEAAETADQPDRWGGWADGRGWR